MGKLKEIGKELVKTPLVIGWVVHTVIDGTRFMVRTEEVMNELGEQITEEKHDELLETYVKMKKHEFNEKPINKYFGIRLAD